eukprot:1194829-Prorocentrum_minimum.AAC.3
MNPACCYSRARTIHVHSESAVDSTASSMLNLLRDSSGHGINEEAFDSLFTAAFTAASMDGRVVEVAPNGRHLAVTWRTRAAYCAAVEAYRIREVARQASDQKQAPESTAKKAFDFNSTVDCRH